MVRRMRDGVCAVGLLFLLSVSTGCSTSSDEEGDEETSEAVEAEGEGGEGEENAAAPPEGEGEDSAAEGVEGAEQTTGENPEDASATTTANTAEASSASSDVGAGDRDLANIISDASQTAATGNTSTAGESDIPQAAAEMGQGGSIGGAAGMPAAMGLPELGSKLPYTVKRGETLGTIARKIYGSNKMWRAIAELSGLTNPNLIYPGDVVFYQLTEKSVAFAVKQQNEPVQELTVQMGDTLGKIAQRLYGNKSDWKYVWRMNDQIQNPDQLVVGMKIHYLLDGVRTAQNVEANEDVTWMLEHSALRTSQVAGHLRF